MKHFLTCILFAAWLTAGAQHTHIQYLSGVDKHQTERWDFYIDKGQNSGKWTQIDVPSNWELQGFGVYNYGRNWPVKQPPSDETGQYRYRFEVPANWKGKHVNIVFEGSMTDTYVKINGVSAGAVHQGSFYRFKYDISKLLKYGKENLLEVTVKNWSSNPSVNKAEREADFWLFGGIYRPVYLEALPLTHFEWTALDARADGQFSANLYLKNWNTTGSVSGEIQTLGGQKVADLPAVPVAKGSQMATVTGKAEGIAPWSPEFPNRYQVVYRLQDAKGKVLHEITEKFGFRTVELRPKDGLYVNGQRIIFKGVNRHTFWPESGRASSREMSETDVVLMKEMNMNAVRMSHYPPDKHFLEVCDSLGLFVLDELTGWQQHYDSEVGAKLVKEMVVRDVNHPSVIIWDNGNEGGNNFDLDDDFHLYDPQLRPVIHPWDEFGGVDTHHYKPWDCCADRLFHGTDPFFPTESLHGIYDGGHGAGLEDWWRSMLANPLGTGMFLWSFSDEAVVRTDEGGRLDTQGSNAPDGILGPYREKEGSFYTIRRIWSPVALLTERIHSAFDGRLKVENRYHYTNLNQCRFGWELVRFPSAREAGQAPEVGERGTAPAPNIAPGDQGYLDLELPDNWWQYHALQITATDPHGRELYRWSLPLQMASELGRRMTIEAYNTVATGVKTGSVVALTARGVEVVIDTATATIRSVRNVNGAISLTGGPLLDTLLGTQEVAKVLYQQASNDYVVVFTFAEKSAMKNVTYRMQGDGLLSVSWSYKPKGTNLPFLGASFTYPENLVTGATWLGNGPYRVWKNRLKGAEFGLWSKKYNNTVTGESGWEYPEFKGYHSNLYWLELQTKQQNFRVYSLTDNLYLHLFTPEAPKGAYNRNTDGAFPTAGNLSFLHGISPIGTKFMKPEQTGPMGMPNQVAFANRRPKLIEAEIVFDFR